MESPREPLLLPAASFAAGILLCGWLHLTLFSLTIAVAGLIALFLLALWKAPRLCWPSTLAVMLLLGAVSAAFHHRPSTPELDADSGEVVLLSGCIASSVAADAVQSRFNLELEPGANARITLTAREGETLPRLQYGDRVEVEARVRKPRNFHNPGAFDYAGYLGRQSVWWLASARGAAKLHRLPGTCGSALRRATLSLRDALSSRISNLARNNEYAARLLPALLVGDNTGLDQSWTLDFRRTGTYHAIVISGLHITVVAGVALTLMRWLSVPLTPMLFIASMLAWSYAAVADWQSPAVRSALGFTLFLVGRWFFRQGRLLNLLAATAILLLAIDPSSLFDPGFQLTFLSVGAIGALASPLVDRTFEPLRNGLRALADPRQDLHFEPRVAQFRIEIRLLAEALRLPVAVPRLSLTAVFWLLEMAAVSACVQLALLPPMVAYFHQVSVTGILANLTVVPALSAAVPVGLAAAATGWQWLAMIASWLLAIARASTTFWAGVEPANRVPDAPAWFALLLLIATCLFGAALLFRLRARWTALAGATAVGFALLLVLAPFAPDLPPRALELTAIDVGQGDSLLVVFPDSRTLLIDGGGFPVFDRRLQAKLDIGEDVVSPYLWRRGIHRLDAIAITHLHDDHAAGIPAVIRNFHPREVWTGAAPQSSALLDGIRAAARETGARLSGLHFGDQRSFGEASLQVLSPASDYQPGNAARNNDSLVLLLQYGRHKFLLTGDAERPVESDLVARGVLPEVDVLKAGHHGSRTSTTEPFLEATRPLFALVSVGEGNSYGHPYPDVLNRLNQMGTRVLRTDHDGLVRILSDGKRLTVSRYRDLDAVAQPAVFDKSY